jgi:HK97 family phage prohead protease
VPGGRPRSVEDFYDRVRGGARELPKAETKFFGSDGRELKKPGIQGFACLTEKAFEHEGRLVYFEATAFVDSLHDGKHKALLFDHISSHQYGGTAVGLEFANTVRGLAFRMPVVDTTDGWTVFDNIRDGQRACVSVGVTIDEYATKTISGHAVDVIAKATLKEISLCKLGAVPETFATIVDLDEEDADLWIASRSPRFASMKTASNVKARVKRVADALAKLTS